MGSSSLAFADGFFSTDMFEYFLWALALGGLLGVIIWFVKKTFFIK